LSTSTLVKEPILTKPLKSVVMVQKGEKDYKSIKKIVDKSMTKAFSKMFFIRPKSNEIECESIALYYESFLIAKVKYHLEYFKNKKYKLNVDNNVVKAIIFDHSLEPKKVEEKSGSHKQIVIDSKELVIHKNIKQLALNRKGRSINRKDLPSAQTEPDPIKFLDSYKTNVRHLEVSIPEILKKAVTKRPANIAQIINEHIEITSQVLIYTPIFEARCLNLKSHEIKIIPVSAVTGKIFAL
jgi:hypothetical protein